TSSCARGRRSTSPSASTASSARRGESVRSSRTCRSRSATRAGTSSRWTRPSCRSLMASGRVRAWSPTPCRDNPGVPLAIATYNWLKAFHVLAAVLWVGGGVTITLLALLTRRANDPAQLAKLGLQIAKLGQYFFTPLAFVVLGLGLGLMHEGGWKYDQFWVI